MNYVVARIFEELQVCRDASRFIGLQGILWDVQGCRDS